MAADAGAVADEELAAAVVVVFAATSAKLRGVGWGPMLETEPEVQLGAGAPFRAGIVIVTAYRPLLVWAPFGYVPFPITVAAANPLSSTGSTASSLPISRRPGG